MQITVINKNGAMGQIQLRLIHVFGGGEGGWQIGPFAAACRETYFAEYVGDLRFEVMYVSDIKKCNWSPDQFVDWLLEADCHIIITHLHQGIPQWNIKDILQAMRRLCGHQGFPTGHRLFCPVFTQNKLKYLRLLPSFMHTPTFSIRLSESPGNSVWNRLDTFLDSENEGAGWIVKFPFVTNREGIQFCKTKKRVAQMVSSAAIKYTNRIPYCMVQPCLLNRCTFIH